MGNKREFKLVRIVKAAGCSGPGLGVGGAVPLPHPRQAHLVQHHADPVQALRALHHRLAVARERGPANPPTPAAGEVPGLGSGLRNL